MTRVGKYPMARRGLAGLVAGSALMVAGAGAAAAAPAGHDTARAATDSRYIQVQQRGAYVANLCIQNQTKDGQVSCTGNVPVGSNRQLQVPAYTHGDKIVFSANVVAGHNAYYTLSDNQTTCTATGTSLIPSASCSS